MSDFYRIQNIEDDNIYYDYDSEAEARAEIEEHEYSDEDWTFMKITERPDKSGDVVLSFYHNRQGVLSGMVIQGKDKSWFNMINAAHNPHGVKVGRDIKIEVGK